ncbi:HEXXH motif domain-containing protein [Streptosporangium sp. CA-135522]|uniref:HEXXH motif domain-containing protein n=1 Tax=Streptosporangium sp. CA-135522 TaxID=3240072 RepID=UPI003D8BE228
MIQRYVIPGDVFTALAEGGGGMNGIRFLAGTQRSKHLLLLRSVVATAAKIDHHRAGEMEEAYGLLAALQADHPDLVEPVLRHPTVGTWALRTLHALSTKTGGPLSFAYLPAMAAAAALRSGVECAVDFTVHGSRVVLPSLGVARLPVAGRRSATRVTVRSAAGAGEVLGDGRSVVVPAEPYRYAEGWTGLRTFTVREGAEPLTVTLDDLDPYRLPKGGPAGRQGPVAARRWERVLEEGWSLLVAHHPKVAAEISAATTTLVPMRSPAGRQVSATSRTAFGAVALSLPKDGRTLASVLAHEVQHAKLWALLDLLPLVNAAEEPDWPRWYAPWRDDPRPLVGLLQGAYAHLAVADFWRTQRFLDQGEQALRAHADYARWRQQTGEVVTTLLESGRLSPAGVEFVTGMAATLESWKGDDIPFDAMRRARAAALNHRAQWGRRHPGPGRES